MGMGLARHCHCLPGLALPQAWVINLLCAGVNARHKIHTRVGWERGFEEILYGFPHYISR